MERLSDGDPRSAWERMQSRPRVRRLIEGASAVSNAVGAWIDEDPNVVPPPTPPNRIESPEEWRIHNEIKLRTLSRIEPGKELDALAYARHRRERSAWVTMEIGPGSRPSGMMRRDFTGSSAYIGIENYSYGEYSDGADAIFRDIREKKPGQNIFLRSDRTFGRTPDRRLDYYDFPDGVADEVYLSQVYDKPINDSCERNGDQQAMTNEVARLLKPEGKVLIFDYERNLEDILRWLKIAGLELRFVFRRSILDTETGEYVIRYDEESELQMELDCIEGDIILIAEKPASWTRSSAGKIRAPIYPEPS